MVQGSRFKGFKGGGVAHFVILSGEKGRVLKNGLSENMRTESKDLSAAKYKNSLPLEGNAVKLSKILIAHASNSVCFFHPRSLLVNNKIKKLVK